MHIICLTPSAPGAYNDHYKSSISTPPEGWAYIPEDFPLPATFPRLGSLEAEEITYTREVEVEKPVTKERDTGMVDEYGNPLMEEYTKMEPVTEEREYTMMTVTAMTPGVVPESESEPDPAPTQLDRVEAQAAYTAMMTNTLLEV